MVFSDASIAQRRIGGPAPLGEDRITIFQVREHRPASVKPLAEVRETIIAALKRERGSAAALAAAEAAAAKLKAGGSFDQAIAGLKAKAEQPRFVGRTAPDVPVQLRDAAFAGPRPTKDQPQVQALKLEDGSAAVLAVTDSRVQSFTDNAQIQQLRTQRELRRYSLRDIDAYMDAVVAATKVRKNPQAFQQ
jgi:peptidyl-prolyl cis-trans isomerase D